MIRKVLSKTLVGLSCVALMSAAANSNHTVTKTVVLFSKANKGKINVHIKGKAYKKVALYLFNSGGQLVQQTESTNKSTITLQELPHGQYLYQCFENDVQLKSGNLSVYKNSIDYD